MVKSDVAAWSSAPVGFKHKNITCALVCNSGWFEKPSGYAKISMVWLMFALLVFGGCQSAHVLNADSSASTRFVHDETPIADPIESYHQPAILKKPPAKISSLEPVVLKPGALLSLDQARYYAVRDNPDVHAAIARLDAAGARIDSARSRFYPAVSLRHTSTRTFFTPTSRPRLTSALQAAGQFQGGGGGIDVLDSVSPLLRPLVQPLFNIDLAQGSSNPFSDNGSAFSASWLLFDGFIRDAQLRAAKFGRHAALYGLSEIRRLIIQAVDRAYYQVQLAQEQTRIALADEGFSQEQYEETKKLQAAGRSTQADVDNFRVRVLSAQANLVAAHGLRDTGLTVLGELMNQRGLMRGDRVTLSPLSVESDENMALPDSEIWRKRALERRPDLLQLRKLVAVDAQRIKAAQGLYSPTVQLNGTWGFDRTSTLRYTRGDQSSGVGIEVRWDLYTGGDRKSRVRRAKADHAQTLAQLQRAELAVESSVKQAIIDLADAQEQIRLQRESLTTALENRRIVQVGYLAGKETLNRLNETQRDFIAADVNLSRARIQLRQAWSDLYAAASDYDDDLLQLDSD